MDVRKEESTNEDCVTSLNYFIQYTSYNFQRFGLL